MATSWTATAGTVLGAEHRRLGRNNQDGASIGSTRDALAVVVTDGCSEGRYSEVGARLAAEWIAAWAPLRWSLCRERADVFAQVLSDGLVGFVRRLVTRFGVVTPEVVVGDYFLFTFLVGVVGRERGAIVGAGDGVYAIDDELVALDAGPDNAPRYIAYDTVRAGPSGCAARVHRAFDVRTVDTITVATDGALDLEARASEPIDGLPQGGLHQFAAKAAYRKNPTLLHKRLQVIGRRCERLPDDTTVATIQRRVSS